jgi:uncharacterized protein (TIGR00255 family)
MTMRSMTGFGRGTAEKDGVRIQVEAGSVNRKSLDVHVSLPRGMAALETVCQKLVSNSCKRGRIQLRIQIESAASHGVHVDQKRAAALLQELNTFAQSHGLSSITDVDQMLTLPGFWSEEEDVQTEALIPLLKEALSSAICEMCEMREKEGKHLQDVLLMELEGLAALLETAGPLLQEARMSIETRLRKTVSDVAEAGPEVEQRLLQEIAMLAEKGDVQEEVDRLHGHVTHFREKMKDAPPVGRALDFLCQELAREWHTLSVKTPHAGLNHLALQGKETVERLREQVQNVE